jgi:hypothetical protein
MQKIFYEYLILYRQMSLPGMGTVCLEQTPAKLDFTNKQILPPSFFFKLDGSQEKTDTKFREWIAASFDVSEWEAIKSLNEFSFALKEKIAAEGKAVWENVGSFSRDERGNLVLESITVDLKGEQPVPAEKVIREHAEHVLLVGGQEKSSLEMEAFFTTEKAKADYAWLVALILTALSVLFAGWHLSGKGFTTTATGNQSVLKTK